MSGKALGWALDQPIPMSSAKFVLAVLADQTTSDVVFMAAATIAARTALDRKTVLASLARLVEWGLLEDTGERRGRTGQIPVYRLMMNDGLFDTAPFSKSPEIGTVPKTGPLKSELDNSPDFSAKSTDFPAKESQKRDTDLKLTQKLDPTHIPRASEPEPEPDPSSSRTRPAAGPVQQPEPVDRTSGAFATRAMIDAGLPATRVNPSHPELLAALASGVRATELADVARECLARGGAPPSMTYVIRTAVGRHRDLAAQPLPRPNHACDSRPRGRPSAAQRTVDAIRRRRELDGGVPVA